MVHTIWNYTVTPMWTLNLQFVILIQDYHHLSKQYEMYKWLLVAKAEQKASLETIKCLKKNTKATGQPSPAQLVNLSLHPAKFQRNFASAQEKDMLITWKFWGVLHSQKLTYSSPWK